MINTYNETNLHKFFKEKYSSENNGFTEVKVKNYICDIFTENSEVIEIQTSSLYKLVPKIQDLCEEYKIKVVFPFPFEKTIEYYSESGEIISKKRSPKKCKWIHIFPELFGFLHLILDGSVILEVVAISIIEKRIKTETPVQNKTNSRRFLKNWYKDGKSLNSVIEIKTFEAKNDFTKILKTGFSQYKISENDFTGTDLKKIFTKSKLYRVLSLLQKNQIIELTRTEKNKKFYKISEE